MVWSMIQRRLHREFPFFLSYLAYAASTCFALMAASKISGGRFTPMYAATFYAHLLGCLILRFAVIYELLGHVLRAYPGLQALVRMLFRWAFAILLLIGTVLAAYAPAESRYYGFSGSLWVFERTASLTQVGLLILLLLFSSYFKLSWREYSFGVGLGLGIYASIELALSTIYANELVQVIGTSWGNRILDLVDMGTYHVCVLLWMVYLLAPERKRALNELVPQTDLAGWNAELDRLARR
jgi:hypothetical protein